MRQLFPLPAENPTLFFRPVTLPLYTTPVVGAVVPEFTMTMVSSQVTAKCRKLKAVWTVEESFLLQPLHGEEIEIDAYQA